MRNCICWAPSTAAWCAATAACQAVAQAQGVDDAGELDQEAIAQELDQAAPVARDQRLDHVLSKIAQARQGPRLIGAHQAGVTNQVGNEDRSQTSFQRTSPPAGRLAGARPRIHGLRGPLRAFPVFTEPARSPARPATAS